MRSSVLLGLAVAAGLHLTPLCADAHADQLSRAIDLYNAAAEAAYVKATALEADSYDVTECTLDGARGVCKAHLFGVSNLGWVRSDFTVTGSWRAGRLTVTTGPDRWRFVTKQEVYDASHPAAGKGRLGGD